ncbi:MAG TPA: HDOD domain-containing protein [Syntrophorhabdaceae bacterium]|nr:HDOD domain-containing protein [Syntrophorhabdaceae bacterium]HPU30810.1 HDOD domain-containing protein [Syntrophorhabdaceae bacterium]
MLDHSLFVALSTRLLLQKMGIEEQEEAFTLSLLHDIGKIVFFMHIEWYGKLIEEAKLKRESLADMEKDTFGIDHQETGYILGLKWKLPEIFLRVIKHHHSHEITNDTSYYILKFIQEADRFFYYRDEVISSESYILNKEKENLLAETDNLLSILEH